jgi:hypothetical protein
VLGGEAAASPLPAAEPPARAPQVRLTAEEIALLTGTPPPATPPTQKA